MAFIISFSLLSVLTAFIFWHWHTKIRCRGLPLPPGPKGYPIIGNVYDIPHGYAWLHYAEWAKKFGDVMYMQVFGTETIVLNSLEAANELLEKRSANYADRPDMIMANELMEWGWDFAHMRHSEWWRRHRKAFHQYFQPRAVVAYQPMQEQATTILLQQLLETPDCYAAHVRQHSGSIILRLVYGYTVQAENDYYVQLVDEAIRGLGQAVHAGSFFVDYLPALKYIPAWIPGAGFQKIAKKWAKASNELRDDPFNITKEKIHNGTAIPSFVAENLDKMNNLESPDPDQEDVIKNCAGIAFLAGSDTTVSVVLTCILAMTRNQNVLARVQAELDSVTGTTRLPNFKDRPSLSYLEAVLSETLRWYPVTPLSLPHRSIKEDVYEGLYIPAGATIISNSWAILHDENLYPEPFKFKPERFLKETEKDMPPDPISSGAFGFGRRVCPGRYLAINSAWIAIACILASFNICKPIGADGKEFDPPVDYTDGLVVHPKAFPLRLIPRSPEATNLIRSARTED